MANEAKGEAQARGRDVNEDIFKGQYELGEFIFEFSQLEFTIRAAIGGGLKIPEELRNQILSLYDFKALCTVWRTVMTYLYKDKEKDINDVANACARLNDNRVFAAHGLWMLGAKTIEATHVSRGSLKVNTHFSEPGELKALSKESQRLFGEILRISGGVFVTA